MNSAPNEKVYKISQLLINLAGNIGSNRLTLISSLDIINIQYGMIDSLNYI